MVFAYPHALQERPVTKAHQSARFRCTSGWRVVRVLAMGPALLVIGTPFTVGAQSDARGNGGDAVRLMVRPRVGDTLSLHVEQTIEMRGRRGDGPSTTNAPGGTGRRGAPPPPVYGPRANQANARVTRIHLYAHSLVESSNLTETTLLATTDSIAMWTGVLGATVKPTSMPMPVDGRQVRVRVTPDGAMRVTDPPPAAMELGATLASVPGLLPEGVVMVGSEWQREMVLPSLPVSGYRADGVVQVRLRLDSLSRNKRLAWISLTGVLRRDGAARELPPGTRMITAGTIRGGMVVDRQRAWIVEARTVLDMQSEVTPGPAAQGAPMLLDIRILQAIKVK